MGGQQTVEPEQPAPACPVCGDEYNHMIDNGHRNGWPTEGHDGFKTVDFEVCTPSDEATMFVHTEDIKTMVSGDALGGDHAYAFGRGDDVRPYGGDHA